MSTGIIERSGICYLNWSHTCCHCGFWNSVTAVPATMLLDPTITCYYGCFRCQTQGEASLYLMLSGFPTSASCLQALPGKQLAGESEKCSF